MPEWQPYQGPAWKLVLVFDMGTTYSSVLYSILNPGDLPVICSITQWVVILLQSSLCSFSGKFPATDHVGGESKIPSIVYYDQEGIPRAFSGKALQESIIEKAKDEEWIKVEWWDFVC